MGAFWGLQQPTADPPVTPPFSFLQYPLWSTGLWSISKLPQKGLSQPCSVALFSRWVLVMTWREVALRGNSQVQGYEAWEVPTRLLNNSLPPIAPQPEPFGFLETKDICKLHAGRLENGSTYRANWVSWKLGAPPRGGPRPTGLG